MLLGAVAKATGFALMYRCSVVVILLYLIIYLAYVIRERRRHSRLEPGSS
jgi:inner membrane protein involved in colicin E2 resistance